MYVVNNNKDDIFGPRSDSSYFKVSKLIIRIDENDHRKHNTAHTFKFNTIQT